MQVNKNIAFAIFGSTQRCGTTLLQRMAGANPSSICWGENGRILNQFMAMKQALIGFSMSEPENSARYLQEKDPEIWIANMSPSDSSIVNDAFLKSGKILFESLYFQSTPESYYDIGVKEVEISIEGVEFFKDMFPLSKVMLVARNPVDVWRSVHHWGYTHDEFFALWKKIL